MRLPKVLGAALVIGVLTVPLATAPAEAAQSLQRIQAEIVQLEVEASSAAEGAQAAKVQLAQLTRTLTGIRQEAHAQGQTVVQLRKSLGAIAVEQYQSGGLGQGLELLFSSDPTLYLSAAGSLHLRRRQALCCKSQQYIRKRASFHHLRRF